MLSEKELLSCVEDFLELTPSSTSLDVSFDALGLDSLEFLELMIEIKEKFGRIPSRELVAFRTPRDVLSYYQRWKNLDHVSS